MNAAELARFTPKYVVSLSGCWKWIAQRTSRGYGQFRVNNPRRSVFAHRLAYEHWRGKILTGLELDHLCRNPSCVNPEHLEAVTHSENMKRSPTCGRHSRANYTRFGTNGLEHRTHCNHGHAFTEDNTGRRTSGRRFCRTCSNRASQAYRDRNRTVDGLAVERGVAS